MAESFRRILGDLVQELAALRFSPPVTHVYNPLIYASKPHDRYLRRFGKGKKEAVFLGMNPGPWGMAQTGIPFGEVNEARDWLGLEAPVGRPDNEHPKRPVTGFDCQRSEVSGRRLWSFFRERFLEPELFFERFFVVNYCPLVFMEEGGRNRTPDKLPNDEREPLFSACDRALQRIVRKLDPELVIGVGAFARDRARIALAGQDRRIETILHPSPASPAANRGWAEAAANQLGNMGIELD